LLAKFEKKPIEKIYQIPEDELPKKGKERERVVKTRVNQSFFRSSILTSYNNTCCISGLKKPSLLIAGHIVPWAEDHENRLNPRNGLCLNSLHDKAFENGLITITPDYKINVSKELKKKPSPAVKNYFLKYEGRKIGLPSRFLPDPKFLEHHNEKFANQY